MDIAEGQHRIDATSFGERAGLRREGAIFQRAEQVRVGGIDSLEVGNALLDPRQPVAFEDIGVPDRSDECAVARSEIRREDIRVPAAAGPDLDHGLAWLDFEEFKRCRRIAPGIARLFIIAAPLTCHRIGKGQRAGFNLFDDGRGFGLERFGGGIRSARAGGYCKHSGAEQKLGLHHLTPEKGLNHVFSVST